MASIIALILGVVVLFGAPLAVVGLVVWARRLAKSGAPKIAARVAYAIAAIVTLLIVAGDVGAIIAATPAPGNAAQPSEKARALAEGISAAMNGSAFALLIAIVAYAAFGLWRWRSLKQSVKADK